MLVCPDPADVVMFDILVVTWLPVLFVTGPAVVPGTRGVDVTGTRGVVVGFSVPSLQFKLRDPAAIV